ncbi:MAG: AraC family transcriptional regulator [Clostridium sp.]|uniref:AraC family transcriptional regulator n=1 Tax=Clostridium sp. TaxID=1506 RepID=UPI003EE7F04C
MKYFEFKETKEHGTFDFPIEFYYITKEHPRYNMNLHWHTHYELIRILEGEFSLTLNDEIFLAKQDDIVFLHDGVIHGGTPKNCIYECIVFDINLLLKNNPVSTKLLQDFIKQNKQVYTLISGYNSTLDLFLINLFESIKTKNEGYELLVHGLLYSILGLILQNKLYSIADTNLHRSTESLNQLKKALTLLENHYYEPLTLEDLSKSAGMTPKYFCKFFHKMTNKTPIEYLNYYRIQMACEMLLTSSLSITDISLDCGFNDTSYFIKTFKKFKKLTPKKYALFHSSK